MAKDVSTTMRSRRVIFDEFHGTFFVESRVEALQRQCAARSSETEVLNKSQDARFEFEQKQIEAARRIFERKLLAEGNQHRQNLKEHIAYKQVLDDLARQSCDLDSEKYLLYVPGLTGNNEAIQAMIEKRIKENTPSCRRRKAAKKLLEYRKPPELFDRGKSTSALLQSVRRKRDRHSSKSDPAGRQARSKRSTAQLILPPIAVTMNQPKPSSETVAWNSDSESKVVPRSDLTLPSVFLTQNGPS